jgi:hypothetical protein
MWGIWTFILYLIWRLAAFTWVYVVPVALLAITVWAIGDNFSFPWEVIAKWTCMTVGASIVFFWIVGTLVTKADQKARRGEWKRKTMQPWE